MPANAAGTDDAPVLGRFGCGLTIVEGTVVDVVASGATVVDVVVVDPSSPIVVDVVLTGEVVVVAGAVVVVSDGTVVVVAGAVVVVVVVAGSVVVVAGTVVVVVAGTVVVVVAGAVVVVTGSVVVVAGAVVVVTGSVVVVAGSVVVVVVVAGSVVVVVVVAGSVVVVVVVAGTVVVVVVVAGSVVVVVVGSVVVVAGAVVVVTVGVSGNWIERKDWSPVMTVLLVETRIWQLRKSVRPLMGESAGSFGERQLNNDCGLSPLKGVKAWLMSSERNVAVPALSAITGACELPKSQFVVGDHPLAA